VFKKTSGRRQCFAALRVCVKIFIPCLLLFVACKREQRQFTQPPSTFKSYDVTMSDIHPGSPGLPLPVQNPSDQRAFDTNEGKRLFTQYNCSGCHFNGGGGIGPPLMDEKWIYGENPENIYSTIVEGRPNGMPSFRKKIPDYQVWELAAYVKTLSSQLRKDIEPGRSDDLNPHNSEQRSERKKPQNSGGVPPSAQQP
jgi:cytochrome c oxidase cbb3-type subunit III